MCGIAGFFSPSSGVLSEDHLRRMNSAIAHRGPDDDGFFFEPERGVGLAHRRLAILDLSPEGHQPMASPSGRFTIVFNGEVFNFQSLRSELSGLGFSFRGGSDTEVMLAAFEQWGIEEAVKRFVGMFVFALWDSQSDTLTLARDRLGIKPLYYTWSGGMLLFGSELKAIAAHPRWSGTFSPASAELFLGYGYIPAPTTIYESVWKLPPGHILQLRRDESGVEPSGFSPAAHRKDSRWLRPYWAVREFHDPAQRFPESYSAEDAVAECTRLLEESVGLRMIADVPLGAFLSGGIDSSLVVALMQKQSSRPVRTFTIAFPVAEFNEADHARAVANHLGTDHTEFTVDEQVMIDTIPELSWTYDEPFGDSSQIPTLIVSRLARQSVTVALSGDGGDELFCGYNRYLWPDRIWGAVAWAPQLVRRLASGAISATPAPLLRRLLQPLAGTLNRPEERLEKLCHVMKSPSFFALYRSLLRPWSDAPSNFHAHGDWVEQSLRRDLALGFPRGAMLNDQLYYLPDDNLTKVDRASMQVALEVRVPLLDHRVVEFSARLPTRLHTQDGRSKWLLRQILSKHVPTALIDRPKMGFSVPIGRWLRTGLRPWAEDLLTPASLQQTGVLDVRTVTSIWSEHLSGKRNHQHILWNILALQAWNKRWRTTSSV